MSEPNIEDLRHLEELFKRFQVDCQAGLRPNVEAYCAEVPEPYRQQFREELLETEQRYRPAETVPVVVSGSSVPLPEFLGYEVERQVGVGGMGVVYKAWETSLKRFVALKTIRAAEFASARDRSRFRFEAEATARLDHPNIVTVYGVGEANGQPYLAMKWIEGRTLAAALPEPRGNLRGAVALLAKVARAVHHAHQRGILHRDLKPANILLDTADEPHVTDFGLAHRLDTGTSQSVGGIAGTPQYMAPEQSRGEHWLSAAVDVYGLGAILYEMLTGRPPFVGENALAVLQQVAEEKSPPRPADLVPGIDENLEAVCLMCLERDPADRYASAQQLAEDLERCLRDEDPLARPPRLWDWLRQVWRNQPLRGDYDWQNLAWMGLVVLVTDVVLCAVVWLELVAAWAWGVLAARVGVQWALYRGPLRRFRELSQLERHTFTSGLSLLAFHLALWFMYVPLVPWAPGTGVVHIFPPLQAGLGMMLLIQGTTVLGRLLPAGLTLIVLSPLLAWLPAWSPLLHAAMNVAVLWWWSYYTWRYFLEDPSRE